MKKGALVSLRIEEELADRLNSLAKSTGKTKSFIASQAIQDYLALQEWQVEAIKEGIDAADRGEMVGHEEAVKVLNSWGAKRNAA
ncbi:MAG: CopG family ribbon-helix-helix protein [Desulfuromonadales bacterium]|nr:CopG family ribbon-helix-helix protein [Desulfuromonadales bacterium]